MLVNGAKLGYGTERGSYTNLVGCVELPDIGGDSNKVDHSAVDDEYKQYELGQKDAGDLIFKFRYRSKAEKTQYKTMRDKEAAGDNLFFCLTLFDGLKVEFSGTVSTKLLTAGGPDTPVNWQLTIGLSSDFTTTDATEGP